jgi:polyhydroxyalkanoate synthesis repressor PhaR
MIIIKRYSNRKLYNTTAKQYITLEGIAELLRKDEDVQVVDHASGEDLTALTLAQIIFDQEKKSSGLMPRNMLNRLVHAGEDKLSGLRRALFAPGDMARQVDEEIERRIQALIAQKKLSPAEGARLQEMLLAQGRFTEEIAKPRPMTRLLSNHGVPTREDLQQLAGQVESLSAEIETLRKALKSKKPSRRS